MWLMTHLGPSLNKFAPIERQGRSSSLKGYTLNDNSSALYAIVHQQYDTIGG